MALRRGEVWWVDFDPAEGSEPNKVRPAILLQNNTLAGLETRLVVPVFTNPDYAGHRGNVSLQAGQGGLQRDSVAIGHLVTNVSLRRFQRLLGVLSEDDLADIELAVAHCLGIAM